MCVYWHFLGLSAPLQLSSSLHTSFFIFPLLPPSFNSLLPPSLPLFSPSDELPAVSSVSTSPVSQTDIVLSWVNPSSDCYQFSSHSVSCSSTVTPSSNSSVGDLDGGVTTATVTGLADDTAFTCVVLSTVSDAGGSNFSMMSSSLTVEGFTYPDCELNITQYTMYRCLDYRLLLSYYAHRPNSSSAA